MTTQSWLLPVGQSLLVDGNLDLVLAGADVEHVNSGWDAGTSLGGTEGANLVGPESGGGTDS